MQTKEQAIAGIAQRILGQVRTAVVGKDQV